MVVRRGEEKAGRGCAVSPLIKEPVAKALSKAPFECKCGVICPGISHVPNTDFICLSCRRTRGQGHNTQVGIIQGSLSVSSNYTDGSQRVKCKLSMASDKQYRL